MTKQTTIIIIALIFFILGFVSNNIYDKQIKGDDTFQAGWQAAKQRLAESNFMPIMEDMEITFISGEVTEVQGNKISLKIQPLEPLADPELDNRIVEIDENTKIYQLVEKDQVEYQKEMEEFNKKMMEQMENPEAMAELDQYPEPYIKEEASLDNIQVGQTINVEAQENIKDVKQFKVIEIIIQSAPGVPTAE